MTNVDFACEGILVTISGLAGFQNLAGDLSATTVTEDEFFVGDLAWDTSSIVITPTATVVAGTHYVFSFNVTNPVANIAATPKIGMSTLTNTEIDLDIPDRIEKITSVANSYEIILTGHPNLPESVLILKKKELVPLVMRTSRLVTDDNTKISESTKISHTNPYPCHTNVITVALVSNVKLYIVCKPFFTITGLKGTATPSTFLDLTDISPEGSVNATGTWTKVTTTQGTLVVEIASDVAAISSTINRLDALRGYQLVEFSFTVTNGAAGQESPVMTITPSAETVSESAMWSVWTSASSSSADPSTDRTWSGTPEAGTPEQNTMTQWMSKREPVPYPRPMMWRQYPMFIMTPVFTKKFAAQSSPFPCDNNTISVLIQSNVPLVKECTTIITITGFTSDATTGSVSGPALTDSMPINFLASTADTGSSTNIIAAELRAIGDWDLTRLIVNLTDELVADDADNSLEVGVADVMFSFDVTNALHGYDAKSGVSFDDLAYYVDSPILNLSGSLNGGVNTANSIFEEGAFKADSRGGVVYNQTIDGDLGMNNVTVRYDTSKVHQDDEPNAFDSLPLNIRSVQFITKSIQQSTPYPCAENTLTISLKTKMPLMPECVPTITITGLTGSTTTTTPSLAMEGGDAGTFSKAGWNMTSGDLILSLATNMKSYQSYELKVTLVNQATEHASVEDDIVVKLLPLVDDGAATTTYGEDVVTSTNDGSIWNEPGWTTHVVDKPLAPMYIRKLKWVSATANHTSPFPCHNNTITVLLTPNVDIGSCTSMLTISALTGSATATATIETLITYPDADADDLFTTAAWDIAGTLIVAATSDMLAGFQRTISFVLTNSVTDQAAPVVQVLASEVTNDLTTLAKYYSGVDNSHLARGMPFISVNETYPLFIRRPMVVPVLSSVKQNDIDAASPCRNNTINVTFGLIVPVLSACTPMFTVSGFAGTATTASLLPADVLTAGVMARSTDGNTPGMISWTTNDKLEFTISGDLTNVGLGETETHADLQLSGLDTQLASETGYNRFAFTFVVMAQATGNDAMPITMAASITRSSSADPSETNAMDTYRQNATQTDTDPNFLRIPTVTSVLMSQSSPYPCDNNTIHVEIVTNVRIYAACSPVFTISGLVGIMKPVDKIVALRFEPLKEGDEWIDNVATWTGSSLEAGVLIDMPGTDVSSTTFESSFQFNVTNGMANQAAPDVRAAISYSKGTAASIWAPSDGMAIEGPAAWPPVFQTRHADSPNGVYNETNDLYTDTEEDRQPPLFIRRTYVLARGIGQSTPWPGANNTIGVTLRFNMDLIQSCVPRVIISYLDGACSAREVILGGEDAEYFNLLGDDSVSGQGTWETVEWPKNLVDVETHNKLTLETTAARILANKSYVFTFTVMNPVEAQVEPDIEVRVEFNAPWNTSDTPWNNSDALLMTQQASSDYAMTEDEVHPYFNEGDLRVLRVYAPAFLERIVSQSPPFPGALNTITVTIASNMRLLNPAVVTISGFTDKRAVNSTTPAYPFTQIKDVAEPYPSARITLAADSSIMCPFNINNDAALVCEPGNDLFRDYSDTDAPQSTALFETETRRILFRVGAVVTAGTRYSFSFQIRNPEYARDPAQPCVRASEILENMCEPAWITRTLMGFNDTMLLDFSESVSPERMDLQNLDMDARPLKVRPSVIEAALIRQSSAFPCDKENTITVNFTTTVPVQAGLNTKVVITGLKGMQLGTTTPVSMAGPPSGDISITEPGNDDVLADTGKWDKEAGALTVDMISTTVAGNSYGFTFDVWNPSVAQDCGEMTFNITGMSFTAIRMVSGVLDDADDANLLGQGGCEVKIPRMGGQDSQEDQPPFPYATPPRSLANASCALKVVAAKIVLAYATQDSPYPCMDTIVAVRLVSNVNISLCAPSITVYGLANTRTAETAEMHSSVIVSSGNGGESEVNAESGTFSGRSGELAILAEAIAPTAWEACMHMDLRFTVKNQQEPRSHANLTIDLQGDMGFELVDIPVSVPSVTYKDWNPHSHKDGVPRYTDWDSQSFLKTFDPLFVKVPKITLAKMGQSTPWPGAENTLKVTPKRSCDSHDSETKSRSPRDQVQVSLAFRVEGTPSSYFKTTPSRRLHTEFVYN
jgi:hypothetical protein